MTRHTLETDMSIGGISFPVEIIFDFTPATSGDEIDPPCQPIAEIITVHGILSDGNLDLPIWLVEVLNDSLPLHAELVALAESEQGPDPDAARDARMGEIL